MLEQTPPFRSTSFYLTLVLTLVLPIGLWFVGASVKAVFNDFDLEVSQLTILFLNPGLPILLLALPFGVVVKEYLFYDKKTRQNCDSIVIVLAIIMIAFACLALAVPYYELIKGLEG